MEHEVLDDRQKYPLAVRSNFPTHPLDWRRQKLLNAAESAGMELYEDDNFEAELLRFEEELAPPSPQNLNENHGATTVAGHPPTGNHFDFFEEIQPVNTPLLPPQPPSGQTPEHNTPVVPPLLLPPQPQPPVIPQLLLTLPTPPPSSPSSSSPPLSLQHLHPLRLQHLDPLQHRAAEAAAAELFKDQTWGRPRATASPPDRYARETEILKIHNPEILFLFQVTRLAAQHATRPELWAARYNEWAGQKNQPALGLEPLWIYTGVTVLVLIWMIGPLLEIK